MLTELSAPEPGAEAAQDVAARLRLPDDFPTDPALARGLDQAVSAALRMVEHAASRALTRRRFRYAGRPAEGRLALPIGPVVTLVAVSTLDAEGRATAREVADFAIDDFAPRPTVVPGEGVAALDDETRLLVDFEAGYGPAWSDAPHELRAAVAAQAAHLFRCDSGEPGAERLMCADAEILVAPYRTMRL
jgi:uncharacterized phiE125 gp8 family phage protein